MGFACYNNYVKINSLTFIDSKPELVLNTVFGYKEFRPLQKEVIENILSNKDTLVIMPTGGGKSLCYQIPALILKGITIVVSPLISLMQDQVAALEKCGIHSVFLNSALEWNEYLKTVEEIKSGKVKIIYVSPEGLSTSKIRDILCDSSLEISCITIDEAHCVSEWGHDFRPDYMEICYVRKLFPKAVMIALTATATEQVKKDIVKNLGLKKPGIFTTSFNRPNIFLEVKQKSNPTQQVIDFLKNHKEESGIIYCTSRKQVDELYISLKHYGYSVLNYHAGLEDNVRAENQDLFIKDKIKIIVATVAFGMGIDKPNVRFVINYDLPKSIEEYYQEIGRAGRDGLPSSALLLYSYADVHKIRYFFKDMADPQKAEMRLQKMINFASGYSCRRTALLDYFGEHFSPVENSNSSFCCDICASSKKEPVDMTIPVQKLLCCIIRTKSRFGATYVIDVLKGSHSKRILENGHNMISTFGIGNELIKEDWFELVNVLLEKGYLQKSGEYNILEITPDGKDLLKTREKVFLPFEVHAESKIKGFPKGPKNYILHKKKT